MRVCITFASNISGGDFECPPGYELDNSGAWCNDVDECTTMTPCSHTCTNLVGAFLCSCPKVKCHSCLTWHFKREPFRVITSTETESPVKTWTSVSLMSMIVPVVLLARIWSAVTSARFHVNRALFALKTANRVRTLTSAPLARTSVNRWIHVLTTYSKRNSH